MQLESAPVTCQMIDDIFLHEAVARILIHVKKALARVLVDLLTNNKNVQSHIKSPL